jgi:hypothetical protein
MLALVFISLPASEISRIATLGQFARDDVREERVLRVGISE